MLRSKSYTLDPFIQPRPELSLRRVWIPRGRGVLIVIWRWHLLIWREAA